jgi:hypothetical protein
MREVNRRLDALNAVQAEWNINACVAHAGGEKAFNTWRRVIDRVTPVDMDGSEDDIRKLRAIFPEE